MTNPSNIWIEDLGPVEDGVRGERLLERAPETRLRSAVWQLDAQSDSNEYHVHHATEELLVVSAAGRRFERRRASASWRKATSCTSPSARRAPTRSRTAPTTSSGT